VAASPPTTLREAGSSKQTRRRIGRRLSATHVLTAVVVVLAFVFNLIVLQDRGATTLVALADRPLVAGAVLDLDHLRLVPVDAGFEGLGELVTEGELAEHEGWALVRTLPAGSLLDRSALAEPGTSSGLRSMSLPIAMEHAAGGGLSVGDRVDVISVVEGSARYVATGLSVVSVAAPSSGAIGAAGTFHVVVAVSADQALDLAEALESGSMEIVRSTGAEEVAVSGSPQDG
jgi:Flp pilus assembly protein CpaB